MQDYKLEYQKYCSSFFQVKGLSERRKLNPAKMVNQSVSVTVKTNPKTESETQTVRPLMELSLDRLKVSDIEGMNAGGSYESLIDMKSQTTYAVVQRNKGLILVKDGVELFESEPGKCKVPQFLAF